MPKVVTAKKTGLASKVSYKAPPKRGPLWLGPEDSSSMGGITQSMLGNFLGCRERFRIKYIEGLRPNEGFNKHLEYGQLWHTCEEALSAGREWLPDLKAYAQRLCKQYPLQQEEIDRWFSVCRLQFPLYVEHWKKHPDNLQRTPLMQEQVFHVPYKLPSGRTVYLRGKFDAVDLIGKGKTAGVFLQENKTKGDIDPWKLQRQLTFDLQSMVYLVALQSQIDEAKDFWSKYLTNPRMAGSIKGIRYNVIRRPLSGGRGSIVRHKGTANKAEETYESYYGRLATIIKEDCESTEPEKNQYWFSRWKVEVSQNDIEAFKVQFLNPILEQLCDWFSWIANGPDIWGDVECLPNKLHWRHPFGTYNVLDEGGSHELDEYLNSGSTSGLTKVDTLFGELQ